MMPLPANSTPDGFTISSFYKFVGFDPRSQRLPTMQSASIYSDRSVEPGETLTRVMPFFQRYGITRLARQTGLDRLDIPVWNAIRPNSLSLAVNQGKGITDIDAKVSAAMEALERAIAGKPEVPSKFTSQYGLETEALRFSPLEGLLGRGQKSAVQDEHIEWLEGFDLLEHTRVWVPRDCVALDRSRPSRYWQSSDGLASGNTPLEALFHGILERIERDAETLWSFTTAPERRQRLVDPIAFNDPVIDDLLARIERADLRLQLFDMTSDIDIPSFTALLGPRLLDTTNATFSQLANGSGTHPDPRRAAIRAITEAAQSRITLIGGSRDDVDDDVYRRKLSASLIEDFSMGIAQVRAYPETPLSGRMEEKVSHVVDTLAKLGVSSLIAVPLNEFTSGFSVIKVIVPELENPPGARNRLFGARALSRMMRQP